VVWWQIVLIIIGSVILGFGIGYLINVLIVHISSAIKKTKVRPVQQNITVSTTPKIVSTPNKILEPSVPDIFTEIEYNRRIASKEWTGELQTFQTRAWDNRGDEVHSLVVEVRSELTEAYSDMALANSISWLSTEMSRRSPSLDESYSKLRSSIAVRLNKVRSQLIEVGSTSETNNIK
jgi:hypothetical protein